MRPSKATAVDDGAPRRRSAAFLIVGVCLLALAAAGVAYPLWWNHRSEVGGQALLNQGFGRPTSAASHVPTNAAPAVAAATTSCKEQLPDAGGSPQRLAGILEIPALRLKAPVLQGLGDDVLNIAVGHDASTPWPGRTGESVLLAHDVSYFSALDKLRPGDQIIWVDACRRVVFTTVSSLVTTPGALLWPPKSGFGLSLVTCWPTNALFWTPQRFVVKAALVSKTSGPAVATPVAALPGLDVPAPPDLVAQGLTLQQNSILLGGLDLAGKPSPTWAQGPSPLNVEGLALEAYFATQKAVADGNLRWWRAIALPGLPLPGSWSDQSRVEVSIEVHGSTVHSVTLTSAYVTMHLVVAGHRLLVGSVTTG